MQVDPINSTLKAPGSKRLKLGHEKLLSNFAFKFNLRRYTKAWGMRTTDLNQGVVYGVATEETMMVRRTQ